MALELFFSPSELYHERGYRFSSLRNEEVENFLIKNVLRD